MLGITCRLAQYLSDRALWLDEAKFAIKVTTFSFYELWQPFQHPAHQLEIISQYAPFGFFALSKALILLLGNNEYILRLFPLVSGIAALFLFWKVTTLYLKPSAALIALILFSFSRSLIYYSSEFRPYSSDVAFALLLFLLLPPLFAKPQLSRNDIWRSGILGAVLLWFSLPTVLLFGGLLGLFLFNSLRQKNLPQLRRGLLILMIWGVSLFFYYCHYLLFFSVIFNTPLYKHALFPFPEILSVAKIKTFLTLAYDFFQNSPLFLYPPLLSTALFIVGCVAIFQRERSAFVYLVSPIFITVACYFLNIYSLEGPRRILFLVPFFLMLIAEGMSLFLTRLRGKLIIINLLIFSSLLFKPLSQATKALAEPITGEEIKPCLTVIRDLRQPEDLLYVYYGTSPQYAYYAPQYGLQYLAHIDGISARDNIKDYYRELDKLRGRKRVWFLFAHVHQREDKLFMAYLGEMGRKIFSLETTGAHLLLFDLEGKKNGL